MKKEVKTSVDGLQVGMYVARLDRPWLKTSFALQGLAIRSKEDIERLRKVCNYVYVDTEQGDSPDPRFWIVREGTRKYGAPPTSSGSPKETPGKATDSKKTDNVFTRLRTKIYQDVKPIKEEMQAAQDAHVRLQEDLTQAMGDLRNSRDLDIDALNKSISVVVNSIIRAPGAMMLVIKLKQFDDTTYSRALGTSVWCATFGRHLGLEKSAIEQLALGGLLLDIGKSDVPVELLRKPGKLTEEEFAILRKHVDQGVRLLSRSSVSAKPGDRLPREVLQMVATHHERANGNGYPQGLMNDEIPMFGRIAGIVDSFDAMTNPRHYSDDDPMSPHAAINELYDLRGTLFQAELVEQFIQTVGLYPTGSLVELSNGEVGAVIAINGLRRLRPTVMLLLDSNKEPLEHFRLVDLSETDDSLSVTGALPYGAYGIDMKEVFL
ncbi:HD-GYP domain-containing protein (c-di-GMP phosphodiesterase class II) [Thiogranum longum]|uniref:HD-GYP domain-containing protein (C-di-GMP phosphodiesterase class II) n=1 Tax=Thiogranum longum TaxID=1537524 RepID=A0A4V2PGR7_9GAMM|nr:HD-GYP domain-containing protein [Thiogranum longum]TCK17876.1 HD-GYP domain-containing protein (c-di-GMP phosphodiesterase class II) [Thiogranum longum]